MRVPLKIRHQGLYMHFNDSRSSLPPWKMKHIQFQTITDLYLWGTFQTTVLGTYLCGVIYSKD